MMKHSILCAQEEVNQIFRKHKRFVEKEITACLNQLAIARN
jgi:hypothetical protein